MPRVSGSGNSNRFLLCHSSTWEGPDWRSTPATNWRRTPGFPPNGSGFSGFALAHNVGSEGEADQLLMEAERAGGRIVKPAHHTTWGGYAGYFADPDGFLWEVAWNPNFPIS